jgi:catechol 2,3-dioxygenase
MMVTNRGSGTLISPEASIGSVTLRVKDIEKSAAFYADMLGLNVLADGKDEIELGIDPESVLVKLVSDQGAPRRQNGTTGLYHFAILLAQRCDLAVVLDRLLSRSYPLQGAANHYVSEAIYLADPEGNGIEVYADRPKDEWYTPEGKMRMGTVALDVEALLTMLEEEDDKSSVMPKDTQMGHVHLHVANLQDAIHFYRDVIGFELMMLYGPSAGFLSAGGYHHHIGVNTWAGVEAPQPERGSTGLVEYSILVPDQSELESIASRAEDAGVDQKTGDGEVRVTDPSGNLINVRAAE